MFMKGEGEGKQNTGQIFLGVEERGRIRQK
jgi:hypothetical protein